MKMRKYFKSGLYLLAVVGFSICLAGSYDDFFSAIRRGSARDVQALLNQGFDPNSLNPQGHYGLMLALSDESWDVAETLVAHNATDVNIRNVRDETPLMLAALKGQINLCRALLNREANVNKAGWTALHYAATNGTPELIQLLLDHYAYVDAESPNGTTPLMMAAMYASEDAVKVLLDSGADVSLRNTRGLSAVDFANRAQKPKSVALIAAAIRDSKAGSGW